MSRAKEIIELVEGSSVTKSLSRDAFEYDSVEDFIKAKQADLPKYKSLVDQTFYGHREEAQEMIDIINDIGKLTDIYNQAKGDK